MSEDDDKKAEVISFEEASHSHVHARKEQKLNAVKNAFRAVTKDLLKDKRKQNRQSKKKKPKKKK